MTNPLAPACFGQAGILSTLSCEGPAILCALYSELRALGVKSFFLSTLQETLWPMVASIPSSNSVDEELK